MAVLEASHCIWTFTLGSNRWRPGVVERISLTLLKACSCSVFHTNSPSAFSRHILYVNNSSVFLCLSCILVLAY